MLVPKEQLGRVNGMIQMGQASAMILGPALGGVLVATIGIAGVIVIDFATFLFAISTLAMVRIPMPERKAEAETGEKSSIVKEALFGWNYIRAHPGFLGLLGFLAIYNFFTAGVGILTIPLILSFAPEAVVGVILSVGGAGLLVGGAVMTKWGGPKRQIYGVIGGSLMAGLFTLFYGFSPSAILVGIGAFGFLFAFPIVSAAAATIWQRKVQLDAQGRVFATRRVIAQTMQPLALLTAGPLADYFFEPLLASSEAPLGSSLGQLIGVGDGRGIGLMYLIMGVTLIAISALSYFYPRFRLLEDEIPDAVEDSPEPQDVVAEDDVADMDPGIQEPAAA